MEATHLLTWASPMARKPQPPRAPAQVWASAAGMRILTSVPAASWRWLRCGSDRLPTPLPPMAPPPGLPILLPPIASDLPEDDRQWLAFYGQNVVYLTTKQLGTLDNSTLTIYVVKSFDGGITFPQVAEVTKPALGVQPGDQGNIVVDQNNGNVYMVFIGAYPNQVYLAKSTDGGLNWLLKLIYQSSSGTSLQHVFPAIAIDRGGNLHVVFNDGRRSLLTSSRDQGASWTTPVQVNTGANAKTSVEPWVVAGDVGKLNIFFYGTSASDFMNPNAQWPI